MESIAIISLLSFVGYYLSNNKSKNENHLLNDPLPSSTNIYHSNRVNEVQNELLNASLQNYNDSKTPNITSILPPIYNNYSAIGINPKDIPILTSKTNIIDNNIKRNNIIENTPTNISERPMFRNTITNNSDNNSDIDNSNPNISLLTGLPIETIHNNQTPFFGSNIRQNIEEFKNETLIENFTGNSKFFKPKKENLQRFKNVPEYNINGTTKTPSFTDNVDLSRYIPSKLKTSEKPFEQERIAAPISFTVDNPITDAQIKQKNVDDLRVKNKPKISYEGVYNPPSKLVPLSTTQSKVNKNKNETAFELGENRLFMGPGAFISHKSDENYNLPSSNPRHMEYYGISKNNISSTTQRSVML